MNHRIVIPGWLLLCCSGGLAALACASAPTRQAVARDHLDAAAARCAERQGSAGRDTTPVYSADFTARGFTGAAPDPRSRFRMPGPGEVSVEFVVDTAGHADLCFSHVTQQSEPGLGDLLLDTVSQWSFTPATYQGRKVRQVIRVVETAVAR